ncbi:MAG: response regulator transcription factor [Lysobacterales bacterium]
MQIALLEDDVDQTALLNAWLMRMDATVSSFTTGQSLKNVLKKSHFDLFLLDWELPDTTGLEVLAWIRSHLDWKVPVIFLTLRDAESDIVRALDAGADDYIVKPLNSEITLARIRNVLRRRHGNTTLGVVNAAPYAVDLEQRIVTLNGDTVALTQREFNLASYLFQHPSQVLSRETLLREVWGIDAEINTRTVDTHISRVRSKLTINAENGWLLHSIYQYGYRLEPISQS